MTPIEFCYWLQGWAELEDGKTPKMEQWKLILAHLQLVFDKQTPTIESLLEEGKNAQYFHEDDLPPLEDLLPTDDEDLREKLLDVVDQLNSEDLLPTQLDFTPPTCTGRPPAAPLDSTLICSTGEDTSDMRFCTNGLGQRIPRKGRDDVK